MKHTGKYQNAIPNVEEVWNPGSFHGNRTFKLIVWSTSIRVLLGKN